MIPKSHWTIQITSVKQYFKQYKRMPVYPVLAKLV